MLTNWKSTLAGKISIYVFKIFLQVTTVQLILTNESKGTFIFLNFKKDVMKSSLLIPVLAFLICSCNLSKKMQDDIYIQQHTSLNKDYPQIDSILIVANGNSATQRIMEDVMPYFTEGLKKRGVNSTSVFVSYTDKRIDESAFNKRNYAYTLWIYEQDKTLQKLEGYDHLVPLAMKLTDNRTSDNVWIATSIFNDYVKKKFYKERYAGTLMLIFRANGIVK